MQVYLQFYQWKLPTYSLDREEIEMSRWWREISGAAIKPEGTKDVEKVTEKISISFIPNDLLFWFYFVHVEQQNVQNERELNSFVEMEQIEKKAPLLCRWWFCVGHHNYIVWDVFSESFLVLIDRRESWSIVQDMKNSKKNFN